MDNLTHTLVGAALAESGLKRRTALATATLLIGANFPDIDVIAVPLGRSLELRRGWTHGVLALAVLPFVLAGLVLAWGRLVRARRRGPAGDARTPVRPGQVLLLAAVSIATHPTLDWLNTYGVRWLMPFDGRWFYGDALFIIDPWVWLALAAGVVLARRRRRRGAAPDEWVRPARWALALVAAYAGGMVALGAAGRSVAARQAAGRAPGPGLARVMAAPVPASPLVRRVVYERGGSYHIGTLTWLPAPRLTMEDSVPRATPPGALPRAREAILATRDGRAFLGWARFPFFVTQPAAGDTVFRAGDLRYTRAAAGSWATVAVGARTPPGAVPDEEAYLLPREITAGTTEADLVRRFGAANVTRGAVELGEGETAPGTVLFPHDSARRLEILWNDSAARAAPQLAQTAGERSRWAIAPGVTLGTTLAELERANARPFVLTGFEWDYSGTVTSWRGGRLDSLQAHGRRFIVRLSPTPEAMALPDAGTVAGDREFPSDHPVMRRLNPRVYEIGILLQ